jgi:hypothetical protein
MLTIVTTAQCQEKGIMGGEKALVSDESPAGQSRNAARGPEEGLTA